MDSSCWMASMGCCACAWGASANAALANNIVRNIIPPWLGRRMQHFQRITSRLAESRAADRRAL